MHFIIHELLMFLKVTILNKDMFFNRHEASFLKVGGFGGGESSTKSWQAKKKKT